MPVAVNLMMDRGVSESLAIAIDNLICPVSRDQFLSIMGEITACGSGPWYQGLQDYKILQDFWIQNISDLQAVIYSHAEGRDYLNMLYGAMDKLNPKETIEQIFKAEACTLDGAIEGSLVHIAMEYISDLVTGELTLDPQPGDTVLDTPLQADLFGGIAPIGQTAKADKANKPLQLGLMIV